jgi:hypothetical protein
MVVLRLAGAIIRGERLYDLLAVIFRDNGERAQELGDEAAVEEACLSVMRLLDVADDRDALRARLARVLRYVNALRGSHEKQVAFDALQPGDLEDPIEEVKP